MKSVINDWSTTKYYSTSVGIVVLGAILSGITGYVAIRLNTIMMSYLISVAKVAAAGPFLFYLYLIPQAMGIIAGKCGFFCSEYQFKMKRGGFPPELIGVITGILGIVFMIALFMTSLDLSLAEWIHLDWVRREGFNTLRRDHAWYNYLVHLIPMSVTLYYSVLAASK